MRKLKMIMQIKDDIARGKKLCDYAHELGVSQLGIINGRTATIDEPILCERIQQMLSLRLGHKAWKIALCSSIASIFSAIAAWIAVCIKITTRV